MEQKNPLISDKKGKPPEKQIRATKCCYTRTQKVYSCIDTELEVLMIAAEKQLTLWYVKSRSVKVLNMMKKAIWFVLTQNLLLTLTSSRG